MSKQRVYFSKSMKNSSDSIRRVHDHLLKCDIEIVEFQEGIWANHNVRSCDSLVIHPPVYSGDGKYYIGKGQYQELLLFTKDKPPRDWADCIRIVHDEPCLEKLYLGKFIKSQLLEYNWQDKYARITSNEEHLLFTEVFNEKDTPICFNKRKLLLCC